jgi:superfamily II DNA or RNA helicase
MSTDTPVYLPPQYRLHLEVAGNSVRQLHRAAEFREAPVRDERIDGRPCKIVTRPDGTEVLVVTRDISPDAFAGDILHIRGKELTGAVLAGESRRRWIRTGTACITDAAAAAPRASEVLASWEEQFFYRMEDPVSGKEGLRPPQMGGLFATLAHWTVAPHEPATIAMPTGAGKTETMLALLVNQRLPRVMVVVPNSALREQIAGKFLSLGVLPRAKVIGWQALLPIVGLVEHHFPSAEEVEAFLSLCNVVITTIQAVNGCSEEIRRKIAELCSHLIIDEAHHVKAPSWENFRRRFHEKPILQFTATPFREDGKHVGGRMIYCYPLHKAQEEGYFRRIQFRSVFSYLDADRLIAETALDQLRKDRKVNLDHLVMARVNTIDRATTVQALYQELAPEFSPLCVHSKMPARQREEAIRRLRARETRIIVCVDMLGEGFDLPQLKIAALHDIHKSLAITLQFTGRFTRTIGRDEPPVGEATMVANRARADVRKELRALYAEDPDWNRIIRELSEGRTTEEKEISEFRETFRTLPEEIPLQNIEPKMSTVVYRTDGSDWTPEAIEALFPEEVRYTREIARSERHHIVWFVTREVGEVPWGEIRDLENVVYHLYLLHWDEDRSLLFINSSNNGSLHGELAKAVCGESAEIIQGNHVYRAMHNIRRMVPTNLGLLDLVSRTRRFMMLVGADTTEGLDPAQSRTKTKTNLFGFGFEGGERVSIGCSLKGRIWSYLVANDLSQWMRWCHHVGAKLVDETIDTDAIFRHFAKPTVVKARPNLVPLAIEWPLAFLAEQEDRISVKVKAHESLFFDVGLEIVEHSRDKPIRFRVVTEQAEAEYQLSFGAEGTRYLPLGEEAVIHIGKREKPLSEWFRQYAPKLFFEQDTFIEHDLLLAISRGIAPFDAQRIEAWRWSGVNIRKESQGSSRLSHTVQYRVIERIRASGARWDVLFDDDDAGEVADVVAIRMENNRLIVHLYHCKYSGEEKPGCRVDDFYAVCGQAQKSVRWRERTGLSELIPHLIHREQLRLAKGEATRFEIGDCTVLDDIGRRLEVLRPEFKVFVVQPGLSKAAAALPVLELLAATSLYLFETYNVDFDVIASP